MYHISSIINYSQLHKFNMEKKHTTCDETSISVENEVIYKL